MTKLERERKSLMKARRDEIRAFIAAKGLALKSRILPLSERFMASGETDCWLEVPIPTALDLARRVWVKAYQKAHQNTSYDRKVEHCLELVKQLDGYGWNKIMHELTKDGSFHG